MPRVKASQPSRPRYTVEGVLLFQVSGAQSPYDPEFSSDGMFIVAGISPVTSEGDIHFCTAIFRCGRSGDEETPRVGFHAQYGLAFRLLSGDAVEAAKEVASTVVWSRFIDLFSISNGQMRARLPPLPTTPQEISQLSEDEALPSLDEYGLPADIWRGKPGKKGRKRQVRSEEPSSS